MGGGRVAGGRRQHPCRAGPGDPDLDPRAERGAGCVAARVAGREEALDGDGQQSPAAHVHQSAARRGERQAARHRPRALGTPSWSRGCRTKDPEASREAGNANKTVVRGLLGGVRVLRDRK